MRSVIPVWILAVLLGIVFPAITFSALSKNSNIQISENDHTVDVTQVSPIPSGSLQPTSIQQNIVIPVLTDEILVEWHDLNNYITGVVLREMPADFETEALKAQAIVARTYALRHFQSNSKHENAAVCMDPDCCQGYRSKDAFLQDGGTLSQLQRIEEAVMETENIVLTYDAKLIDATYFSCSGGRTEAAVAVWGTDIPYLQSVESPGEENARHYLDTVAFDTKEFLARLGFAAPYPERLTVTDLAYTTGGGVESLRICDVKFEGTQLRNLLGLRSTAFVISPVGSTVTVTTKGFGHRVGMSQYGANAMAAAGSTYKEILQYYFQGVNLVNYTS